MKETGGTVLCPNYLQVLVCIKRFKDYANYEDCVGLEAFVVTVFNNIFSGTQPC